jgi:hypothetical protein
VLVAVLAASGCSDKRDARTERSTEDIEDAAPKEKRKKVDSEALKARLFDSCPVENVGEWKNTFRRSKEMTEEACGKWMTVLGGEVDVFGLGVVGAGETRRIEACSHIDWGSFDVGSYSASMPVRVSWKGQLIETELSVRLEACQDDFLGQQKGPLLAQGEQAATAPVSKPKDVLLAMSRTYTAIRGGKRLRDFDWIARARISKTREIECRYQGGVRDTATSFDQEVQIVDRRTGIELGRKQFPAPPPRCGATATVAKNTGELKFGGGESKFVAREEILSWLRSEAKL